VICCQEKEDTMREAKLGCAFKVDLELPYEEALERVKAALKEEGFGVLTEVDVRATMKEKLGLDFHAYTIIGACNPSLSHRALDSDLEAGLVLPCNVVVHEEGERSVVMIADPVGMMGSLGKPVLDEVAQEARERLARVAIALGN